MEDSKESKVEGLLKKVISTGVTAAFMTEEGIRTFLKDVPLPKEFLGQVLENAKNTKSEFVAGVKNELKNYLDKIDLSKELDRIIEDYDFEVNAKISLKKKKTKSSPKKR